MATISRIFVYPIKSLSGHPVTEAKILTGSALQHDREFALFDESGRVVNGKKYPAIHSIEAVYDLDREAVSLSARGKAGTRTFHLLDEKPGIEEWLGNHFGFAVNMKRDQVRGFPDDLLSPGPTFVSTATLQEVATWFEGLDAEQTGRRFRANIEIGDVEPFWEDRLFGPPEELQEFTVGSVRFLGVNPCARCAVPPRHPETGETVPEFQRLFAARRQAALPAWAEPSRFDHFYRLSVNTRVPESEAGKVIRIGDEIRLT